MEIFFSFNDLLTYLVTWMSVKHFGLNVLDVLIIGVILFYSYEGYLLGFGFAGLDFLSFILSFLLGLLFYQAVSSWIVTLFTLPQGFANAVAFFLVAFISEIVITILIHKSLYRLPRFSERNIFVQRVLNLSHPLGILPGLASAYIILSFLLTIIITLPSSPALKQLVTNSRFGVMLVSHTATVQSSLESVFGGAIQDTLNVITVKPESTETIQLNFTVVDSVADEQAEAEMFNDVNNEREKRGLVPLKADPQLLVLARSYATTMFRLGYFSHYTPDGKSPFDRMNEANIIYNHAGENLALAPSTPLAHQGLMNSAGHRANILSPNYARVGIGVMDGGIYGKMFVQEFSD